MPIHWGDGLTPEQVVAANSTGSHVRLLAGPGTGKTHTLGRRVVYLITELEIPASEILILTFTRTSAQDLREKIAEQLSDLTDQRPQISTLHAFALRQLVNNMGAVQALPSPIRIADDWEEGEIIVDELATLLECTAKQIKSYFAQMSADWETLREESDAEHSKNINPQFVGTWDEHRRIYGYTLRSELVYQLKRALEQDPGFHLNPKISHVLVDEYQDLNPCDLAVARKIAETDVNLMACGDDDQSIYGFRFANPAGIRDFPADFPDSADLQLTECQRCDSAILDLALWVARQDRERIDKAIHPQVGRPAGEVALLSYSSGAEEARGVARIAASLIEQGVMGKDIIVLLRTDRHHHFSNLIQSEFQRAGVSSVVSDQSNSPLYGKSGRLTIGLLQLLVNPEDHLAWRGRLNLTQGIGDTTTQAVYSLARQRGVTFCEALFDLEGLRDAVPKNAYPRLVRVVETTQATINELRPMLVAEESDEQPDLMEIVSRVIEREIADEQDRQDLRGAIEGVVAAGACNNVADLLIAIVLPQTKTDPELARDRVNILTMHQAKGLSADVVFVVACEDEMLPMKEDAQSVADDRRLLYVSLTRARHRLYISYSGRREGVQQHSGRNAGSPRRTLTRYLRNGPLTPQSGGTYTAK